MLRFVILIQQRNVEVTDSCRDTDVSSTIGYISRAIYFKCRSHWPRGLKRMSAATRLPRLWVRNPPGPGCLSVVFSVVCCQVEVSATS
jgi:hypothetical protein